MTTVVVGVGNAFRGDDAVGLRVAELLEGTLPERVRIVQCEGEPVALLEAWEGAACAIVIDATQSGAAPGTIRRIDAAAGPVPEDLRRTSSHLLGVADALELARALGRLPETTVLYGIEGMRFDAGDELSPPVAAAVAIVAAHVRNELREDD